jgi:O-antigen/teichoic acid export membrane protein
LNHRITQMFALLSGKMANNGKYAAIDQGIISISNFLATLLLSRLISPTELGIYVIGFLAIYFIRAVQNGIIIQPLNTFGAVKSPESFKQYFSATALHQVILSILTAAAAILLGWLLSYFGNDIIGPTIFILWFCFFTWQLQEFLRRGFYTRGEVNKAIWISLTSNGIRIALILTLSRYGEVTGITGLNAIGWGSLAATLVGIWQARSFFNLRPQEMVSTWRENWQFGRWILGASVADWMVLDLYPIMMAGMISFAATGIYQALQNLVAPIHVLLRAVDTFTTPILAKTYNQFGLSRLRHDLGWIYIISGVPVILLLFLVLFFAPQLLYLISGDTYLAYSDRIYVMLIFYFFLFVNRPLQIAFRAVRQGKQIFIANLMAAFSIFTVGIWLINTWGLEGAIGGQALNAIIISVVLLIGWVKFIRKNAEIKPGS